MNLIGRQAPNFTAAAVLPNGEIKNDLELASAVKGKYGLIFFYPLDFTFVCPSELIALHKRMDQFKERGVEVLAVSIDSQFTHSAWRRTKIEDGGIGEVDFTMVADVNHMICQSYGVEQPESGVAFRGAFILDKNGVVRAQQVNDLPLGRNIDELLRLVDALQFHEANGEVCPAGWAKGEPGMQANTSGVASFLSQHAEKL